MSNFVSVYGPSVYRVLPIVADRGRSSVIFFRHAEPPPEQFSDVSLNLLPRSAVNLRSIVKITLVAAVDLKMIIKSDFR
jgi:hypothetical protein